ncbi:MAG TPA: hypothetical protein VM261_29440 [Kofleriaceae bacterium]|nr:hypothetical protein [Kofleriaceae bacterium]
MNKSTTISLWPNGFIIAFIAIQLLLPLHYYSVRMDRNDERWAWRMFSPTRMVTCEVTMTVDGQPVQLSREFHQAWTEVAQRGRRVVVEEMGAQLCRKHQGKPVVARLACKPIASRHSVGPVPDGVSRSSWLRGPEYFMGGFDLCTIPEL